MMGNCTKLSTKAMNSRQLSSPVTAAASRFGPATSPLAQAHSSRNFCAASLTELRMKTSFPFTRDASMRMKPDRTALRRA